MVQRYGTLCTKLWSVNIRALPWWMFLIEVEANLSQDLSRFRGETINLSHQRIIYTCIVLYLILNSVNCISVTTMRYLIKSDHLSYV